MDVEKDTPIRVFDKAEVERFLREQRVLIADKLYPTRKTIIQETEYNRIVNLKLKVK
jgi:hypothetical protein